MLFIRHIYVPLLCLSFCNLSLYFSPYFLYGEHEIWIPTVEEEWSNGDR